jgi:hypothetical protein
MNSDLKKYLEHFQHEFDVKTYDMIEKLTVFRAEL